MGTKSKFFRAFVEGQTISDGRTVTAQMIDEAAETFNAQTYTPGINVEHIRGFSPEAPFNRYGDVVAVRAQTDQITVGGKTEPRRALYAQVDALDQLVTLAGSGQKPYPSVELTADYAGTKKVGLIGLAFTDNPASIATQRLQFSQAATVRGGLVAQGAEPVTLDFEDKALDSAGLLAGFTAAITSGFATLADKLKPGTEDKPKDEPKPKPANDNDLSAFATQIGETVSTSLATALKPVTDRQDAFATELAAIKTQLAGTEQQGFQRQPANGGTVDAKFVTDC